MTIARGGTSAFLWDTDGAGTIDVYALPDDSRLLVHAWIANNEDSDVDALAALPAAETQAAGEIQVFSGTLGILWSGADGSCIQTTGDGAFQLNRETMLSESSGMLLPLPNGTYHCLCDAVQADVGEAIRCRLVRTG